MDWKELLKSFFSEEADITEFIEKADKMSEADQNRIKSALATLSKIENLPAEAKKAISVLAKLAGASSKEGKDGDKTEKIEALEDANKQLEKKVADMEASYKTSIDELVSKVKALEKGAEGDGDGKPAEGDGKPAEGDGKPAEGDGKPAEGDGKPAEGTEKKEDVFGKALSG